ncbi:MAG: GNAT family N-acetyltransferase [Alphaproteobacteria bacterium]|nr:GNAT family N-acetyltransferase [Alphaproteobacteria bacterium]
MSPPRTLATPRLLLRAWRLEDTRALRALLDANDAHLRPWIPFMQGEPRSLRATRARVSGFLSAFHAGQQLRYAIWLGEQGPLIGEVMLLARGGPGTLELGYWLDAQQTGRGYMGEAARALVELGLGALGAERLILRCDLQNAPSNAVARRLGAEPVEVEQLPQEGVSLQVWELRARERVGTERRNVF